MICNYIEIKTLVDFQNLVENNSKPVILDFWAEWCPPCNALKPILKQAAQKNDGRWVLVCVDVNEAEPEILQKLKIQGIPAVFLYVGGKQISAFVGNNEAKANQMIVTASQ